MLIGAPSGSGRDRSRSSPSTRTASAARASPAPMAAAASAPVAPSGSSRRVPSGSVACIGAEVSGRRRKYGRESRGDFRGPPLAGYAPAPMDAAALRTEFPVLERLAYLNAGTDGPI